MQPSQIAASAFYFFPNCCTLAAFEALGGLTRLDCSLYPVSLCRFLFRAMTAQTSRNVEMVQGTVRQVQRAQRNVQQNCMTQALAQVYMDLECRIEQEMTEAWASRVLQQIQRRYPNISQEELAEIVSAIVLKKVDGLLKSIVEDLPADAQQQARRLMQSLDQQMQLDQQPQYQPQYQPQLPSEHQPSPPAQPQEGFRARLRAWMPW